MERVVDARGAEQRERRLGTRPDGPVRDHVVDEREIGRVEHVAQRPLGRLGRFRKRFRFGIDIAPVREMNGYRLLGFADFDGHAVIPEQQRDLLAQIAAIQIRPRHGRLMTAGARDEAVREPRIEACMACRRDAHERIRRTHARLARLAREPGFETLAQKRRVALVDPLEALHGRIGVLESLGRERLGSRDFGHCGVEAVTFAYQAIIPGGPRRHGCTRRLLSIMLNARYTDGARIEAERDRVRSRASATLMTEPPRLRLGRARFDAVIFDLDGVVTRTARLHAEAWKRAFDEFLERRAARRGTHYVPFDADGDYDTYVDGKPRFDGVASFLAARGIELPYGDPDDTPRQETVCGLGNRKNELFGELLERDGAESYPRAIELIERLRAATFLTAVVSSSKSCEPILRRLGALELFDARIDGHDAEARGLAGKPEPDTFLAAAQALGVEPARAAVLEDAVAGVAAGRAGGFGLVVGVDPAGRAQALRDSGADHVVTDLGLIDVGD